ncbi:MAG TPA: hypothetical protein DEA62_02895 [Coxiellaceae bacterium]|nr:hypothetical protein [Coxiellaceae bacterium]HBS51920.1 hypothetical protein [Coxiellaceae bacterium]
MLKNKPPLEIHATPKQPIQINRSLIIVVTAAITTIILTAIVWALNSTSYVKKNTETPTKITTNKAFVISPELKNLPESYSDINSIKKYSAEQQNNFNLNVIMQQLDDLRNSYDLLKRQLEAKDTPKPISAGDQSAKSSGLFFAGLGGTVGLGGAEIPKQPQEPVDESLKFRDRPESVYNPHKVVKPLSRYQVMAGATIPASLVTGINSTISGTVVAHIRQNIYDTATGKYLLIPRGSKAIGEYSLRVNPGQNRVSLEFTRIIRPDNSSIQLERFAAADLQGHAGLEGDVNNHWGTIIGSAMLGALINYGAGAISDNIGSDSKNINKQYPSAQQSSIINASSGFSNITQNLANRALGMPPTITLPAGYLFNITVNRDLLLTEYNPEF